MTVKSKNARVYASSDVRMLTATKTVCKNFIAHKIEIIQKKSAWSDPFISDFEARINDSMLNHLGIDPAKAQKDATYIVDSLFKAAKADLGLFKVQVDDEFIEDKAKRALILSSLGFTAHYQKMYKSGSQESLIALLYAFKANMDVTLRYELTSKGIEGSLINSISGYADTLNNANVTQESYKSSRKEITADGNKELNAIYRKAIAICKFTKRVFADQPAKATKFSFAAIIKAQSISITGKKDDKKAK